MKKKEIIFTCIDLTMEETQKLIDLLTYEEEQLTELIESEPEYKGELEHVKSILKKLD